MRIASHFASRSLALLLLAGAARLCAQTEAPPGVIPPGPWRIAGTVVNANTGQPLPHARLSLQDARARQNFQFATASDEGRFEFHVPAGKFALNGSLRGFIASSYNQHEQFSTAIVTGVPGVDAENLRLRLPPNAVLTGVVLDESGDPLRRAQVSLYREDRTTGTSRVTRTRGATTDDLGRYEIAPLEPGTYFVAARAEPWYAVHALSTPDGANSPIQSDSALDVAYPVTFYGGVTESDEATPIPVRPGDRLTADIHLTPVPALHLAFRAAQGAGAYPELQQSVFDGVEEATSGDVESVAPGVFEMTGVAPGNYLVRTPDSTGQLREAVSAHLGGNQELDTAAGNSTSSVTVSVTMEDGSTPPPRVWVGLRSARGTVTGGEIREKGEARFSDVVAGKYDLVAGTQREDYTVIRVASGGSATAGRTLAVQPGAALKITATLRKGSVRIEGIARRDGKAFAGAMVVLIPQNPEANVDRFRRDQSDLDGTFTLLNVTPGTYTVIAIEDGWDLDWARPAVLAHYGARGQSVTVRANATGTMQLPGPVAVETK